MLRTHANLKPKPLDIPPIFTWEVLLKACLVAAAALPAGAVTYALVWLLCDMVAVR